MRKAAGCLPGEGLHPKKKKSMKAWLAPRGTTMSLPLPRPRGQLSLPHTAVTQVHYPKQKEALLVIWTPFHALLLWIFSLVWPPTSSLPLKISTPCPRTLLYRENRFSLTLHLLVSDCPRGHLFSWNPLRQRVLFLLCPVMCPEESPHSSFFSHITVPPVLQKWQRWWAIYLTPLLLKTRHLSLHTLIPLMALMSSSSTFSTPLSHPPFILSTKIISLHLREPKLRH